MWTDEAHQSVGHHQLRRKCQPPGLCLRGYTSTVDTSDDIQVINVIDVPIFGITRRPTARRTFHLV